MAKIPFSKLGLSKDTSITLVEWNDQNIEVKNYLPIKEKIELVENIVNKSVDENGYYNPIKIYVNTIIEVINSYTNISFTEKQKEDIEKLYDLLVSSGFSGKIIGESINPYEYQKIRQWVNELINSIYSYKNSIFGILDTISTDYKDLDLNALKIKEEIADPESLTLLKDVLTKLG